MTYHDDVHGEFKQAIALENPLQVVGVASALCAMLAKEVGFKALYISGAEAANAMGIPDLGMTTFTEVAEKVRRISSVVDLPLLVDGDTGFGSLLTLQRMVKEFIQAGAHAVQLEDQNFPKRCGHRPGKSLVSKEEMCDRVKAAVDARCNPNFLIVARTDALSNEGLEAAIDRVSEYQSVGADIIFVEAATSLEDYRAFVKALKIPILANMTEFGQTPLFSRSALKEVGVRLILYPLSAFRAMNKAAKLVYSAIKEEGDQTSVLSMMQTREELYQLLNYYKFESQISK